MQGGLAGLEDGLVTQGQLATGNLSQVLQGLGVLQVEHLLNFERVRFVGQQRRQAGADLQEVLSGRPERLRPNGLDGLDLDDLPVFLGQRNLCELGLSGLSAAAAVPVVV